MTTLLEKDYYLRPLNVDTKPYGYGRTYEHIVGDTLYIIRFGVPTPKPFFPAEKVCHGTR